MVGEMRGGVCAITPNSSACVREVVEQNWTGFPITTPRSGLHQDSIHPARGWKGSQEEEVVDTHITQRAHLSLCAFATAAGGMG